jgi:hypothetical protein
MKRILLLIAVALSASIFTAFAIPPFKGKTPAEYANDPKSDLSGAPGDFIAAVAHDDAIHELEKDPNRYKGWGLFFKIRKIGQGRALGHNLRADKADTYTVSFWSAFPALDTPVTIKTVRSWKDLELF